MSYTNTTLVKNHIEFVQPVFSAISGQQLIFTDNEYKQFYKGQVVSGSVSVKSLKEYKQKITTLTVTTGEHLIDSNPIVNGSLLCCSNLSLSRIYKANIDFIVNYESGIVTFPATGAIIEGNQVTFFYLPYHSYQENSDYKVKYESGKIAIPASSDIQFGEQVYIDYKPTMLFYAENSIENAVVEANAIIEMIVDPNKQFGANLVLQTAATYRALEILCRSSAVKELAFQSGRKSSAKAWIALGDLYLTRSAEMIRSFKEPVSQISNPTHS